MSIQQYFKPTMNLPTTCQAQMSPEILKKVNQAMKAALESAEETGNQDKKGKKQQYTSFTPEDRAIIGQYAIEQGNAETTPLAIIEGVACRLALRNR